MLIFSEAFILLWKKRQWICTRTVIDKSSSSRRSKASSSSDHENSCTEGEDNKEKDNTKLSFKNSSPLAPISVLCKAISDRSKRVEDFKE